MPKDDDQLDYLVAEYNRLADRYDSHADRLVCLALHDGWNDNLAGNFWDLRHQAATHRTLAQGVQDLRP